VIKCPHPREVCGIPEGAQTSLGFRGHLITNFPHIMVLLINTLYVVFSLCCIWCLDAVLYYCDFETCKVKSVLKLLYFERYSFTFHFTKFLSHFLNKLMLNRNYFLVLSLVKKSLHHCVYILIEKNNFYIIIEKNNFVIKQ
jgi:hypothetical protein